MLAAIQSLIDDLGGKANITGAQSLLLDNIRSKLIVLFQIGKFVDREADLINEKGELVSCLNRNFLAFSEGLRRDLEALARMAGKASSDVPDLGKYIEAKYATKGKS